MKILVCIKLIPDPAVPGSLDSNNYRFNRNGKFVLDEADQYGVEQALQLAEPSSGEVVVLTMAPQSEGIQTALSMGADRAIIVTDDALQGADALTTAKVLAAVIRNESPDLIVTATESTDGYTGTLPVQIAEILELPSVTFAKKVEIGDNNELRVERQTENGSDLIHCPLPAVISVTAGAVEPRYPSFKGIMAAKSKPREIIGLTQLGFESKEITSQIAMQSVTNVVDAPSRPQGILIEDDGDSHIKIIDFLKEQKII